MGKARTDRNGYTREQKLLNENKRLKQELSQLRKRLAKIDLDRYDTIKDMIQEHYTAEKEEQGKEILENMKQMWKCHKCEVGYLQIYTYTRSNNLWYYRICSEAPDCLNRTLPQIYDPKQVKGIIRENKDE